MKEALAQIDADGFKYDSRKTVDDFANDLMVKGSEVIAAPDAPPWPGADGDGFQQDFFAACRIF